MADTVETVEVDLTEKQKQFCLEYMVDLNATQAAIRAGYSKNSAREIGTENLSKPAIQEYLSSLMAARSNKTSITAEYVLNRIAEIDQMDVLDILNDDMSMKPIREWPKSWRTTLSGLDVSEISVGGDSVAILKKIKWPDKVKNLELMGRHIAVRAFEKEQDQGNDDMASVLQSLIDRLPN